MGANLASVPAGAGCYLYGKLMDPAHRWESTSYKADIGHGEGPLCVVCGLPWGTWHAEALDFARRRVDDAREDPDRDRRIDEMVALTRWQEVAADRPYAHDPAYEIDCPVASCRAPRLWPCSSQAGRRAEPHARRALAARIRAAELEASDG